MQARRGRGRRREGCIFVQSGSVYPDGWMLTIPAPEALQLVTHIPACLCVCMCVCVYMHTNVC